jgi:hypothetical protein
MHAYDFSQLERLYRPLQKCLGLGLETPDFSGILRAHSPTSCQATRAMSGAPFH